MNSTNHSLISTYFAYRLMLWESQNQEMVKLHETLAGDDIVDTDEAINQIDELKAGQCRKIAFDIITGDCPMEIRDACEVLFPFGSATVSDLTNLDRMF